MIPHIIIIVMIMEMTIFHNKGEEEDDRWCCRPTRYTMMMMMMMTMIVHNLKSWMMPTHQVHDQGEECERRRQKRVRVKELDGKVEPCVPGKRFNQTPRKNKSNLK